MLSLCYSFSLKILSLISVGHSMSIPSCLRFLRPYSRRLHQDFSASKLAAYLQFYAAVRSFHDSASVCGHKTSQNTEVFETENSPSKNGVLQNTVLETSFKSQRDNIRRRVEELQAAQALKYPRIKCDERATTCAGFRNQYGSLKAEESKEEEIVTLRGMFLSTS